MKANAEKEEEEDLFADKLKQGRTRSREPVIDDDEDLFADKLKRSRSRSPTRSGSSRFSQR